jgi:ribosome-binding protein aMBF1 (putative translation factor)
LIQVTSHSVCSDAPRITRLVVMLNTDSIDVLKHIGRNIKAERARRELTQEALAHHSGVAVAQVARMERGESDTGISKYVMLARAMKVTPALLLQDIE